MLTTEVKAKARPQVIDKIGEFLGVTVLAAIIPVLIAVIGVIAFTVPLMAISGTNDLLSMVTFFAGFVMFLTVAGIFIISPTTYGLLRCYYDMQKTGTFKVSTVFSGFINMRNIIISIKHAIINFLVTFVPSIIISSIGFIFIFAGIFVIEGMDFHIPDSMMILGALLVFVVVILVFLWMITLSFKSYAVYFYIFDEQDKNPDEKISVRANYKKAFKEIKGYNEEILYFSFSFILWMFLAQVPLIGSIAMLLFINPYMILSYVHLVAKIRGKDNIDNNSNSDNIVDYADKPIDNTQVQEQDIIVLENEVEVLEIESTKVNLEEINSKLSNETDIPKDEK